MKERERLQQLKLDSTEEEMQHKKQQNATQQLVRGVEQGVYAELLQHAGISFSPSVWIGTVLLVSLSVTIIVSRFVGPMSGLLIGMMAFYYFQHPFLRARAEMRRQAVVPHLPAFIDALQASLRTGYNIDQAVEHATASLPDGILHTECSYMISMIKNRVPFEDALQYLRYRIVGQEMVSLVIAIRLFSDMGGKILVPLKRLSDKMRQQQVVMEKASRDLVLTTYSFYVLLGLSIIVPMFLFMSVPGYLEKAFGHESLHYVMEGAFVVQVLCIMMYRRLISFQV